MAVVVEFRRLARKFTADPVSRLVPWCCCLQGGHILASAAGHQVLTRCVGYRGTSLIRNTHPPRIATGPRAEGSCRVLRGGGVLMSELPL